MFMNIMDSCLRLIDLKCTESWRRYVCMIVCVWSTVWHGQHCWNTCSSRQETSPALSTKVGWGQPYSSLISGKCRLIKSEFERFVVEIYTTPLLVAHTCFIPQVVDHATRATGEHQRGACREVFSAFVEDCRKIGSPCTHFIIIWGSRCQGKMSCAR